MKVYCLLGVQDTEGRFREVGDYVRKVVSKRVFLDRSKAHDDIPRFKEKITNPKGWYKYDADRVHIGVLEFELDLVGHEIKKLAE